MRRAGTGYSPMGGQQRSVYGEENDRMEEELKHKVSALKTLTIDIGEEVRLQNRELAGMDDDMDKVGGFLGSTMGRLKGIARHGYGKMYCYLFLFAMAVFFVMYWMIRLK
ncbi:BET1 homolog [Styela clava]